jgi:hypothetical protein
VAASEIGVVAGQAAPTASVTEISHAAAEGTGMRSEEAPGDTTDRERVKAVIAAPPALDLAVAEDPEVAAEAFAVAAAAGADRRRSRKKVS